MRFENGAAGINFIFHYLVDNHFVDTDIDDFPNLNRENADNHLEESVLQNKQISPLAVCVDRLYLLRQLNNTDSREIQLLEY